MSSLTEEEIKDQIRAAEQEQKRLYAILTERRESKLTEYHEVGKELLGIEEWKGARHVQVSSLSYATCKITYRSGNQSGRKALVMHYELNPCEEDVGVLVNLLKQVQRLENRARTICDEQGLGFRSDGVSRKEPDCECW